MSQSDEPVAASPTAVWRPGLRTSNQLSEEGKAEREIRAILNRVSEGNIGPMFEKLAEIMEAAYSQDSEASETAFGNAYSRIFLALATSQQQQMN